MRIGRHDVFPGFREPRTLDEARTINARRQSRLVCLIAGVLRRGGEVCEGVGSRWCLTDETSSVGSWAPAYRTAEKVAAHVMARVVGFGWPAQVYRRASS